MLHDYDITDGCGRRSLTQVNGNPLPLLRTSRQISSGNFESFSSFSTSDPESFSADSQWPNSDVIPDYPSDDEMTSQVKRLQTFRDWPSSCPVKPKELAAAGFYYAGIADTVRCFRCDLTLRQWEQGDNPWEDHKKHRPHCPFVCENAAANRYDSTRTAGEGSTSSQHTYGNRDVSLGNVTSEKARVPLFSANPQQSLQSQYSCQISEERYPRAPMQSFEEVSFGKRAGLQESGVANPPGYYGFRQQSYPTAYAEQQAKFIPGRSNASFHSLQAKEGIETAGNQPPSSLPFEQRISTEQGRTTRLIQGGGSVFPLNPGSQMTIASGGQGAVRVTSQPLYPAGQAEVQGPCSLHPAEMYSHINSTSQRNPHYPAQSGRTGREEKWSRYPEHGVGVASVNRERPRQMANVAYPVVDPTLEEGRGPLFRQEEARHVSTSADLASEHHRLTTFVDWPHDSPVHPWELSVAGFYFSGPGDSVKCFKCGVALTNWEPDDTPWGEHQKWSPKCPLVVEHFRGRAQMGPVESTAGVPQGHQLYSQPAPPQSPVRRRSPPLIRPPWPAVPGSGSSEPAMPHSTPSSRAPSFRSADTLGYPSSGSYTHSGPGGLPGQEVRHSDVPLSGPPATTSLSVSGHVPGMSQNDVEHIVSMGFERDQVNQVICRRITNSGRNFDSFDELLQAVLSSCSRTTPRATAAREPSPSHFPIQSTLPALPLENEEIPSGGPASSPNNPSPRIEGLRRTMSAPQGVLSGGAEAEKDESLQQKLDRMQEERTCKICMDAEVGVVFLPCGHLSCCPGCASGMEQCPMCRTFIQEKIRTYLS